MSGMQASPTMSEPTKKRKAGTITTSDEHPAIIDTPNPPKKTKTEPTKKRKAAAAIAEGEDEHADSDPTPPKKAKTTKEKKETKPKGPLSKKLGTAMKSFTKKAAPMRPPQVGKRTPVVHKPKADATKAALMTTEAVADAGPALQEEAKPSKPAEASQKEDAGEEVKKAVMPRKRKSEPSLFIPNDRTVKKAKLTTPEPAMMATVVAAEFEQAAYVEEKPASPFEQVPEQTVAGEGLAGLIPVSEEQVITVQQGEAVKAPVAQEEMTPWERRKKNAELDRERRVKLQAQLSGDSLGLPRKVEDEDYHEGGWPCIE